MQLPVTDAIGEPLYVKTAGLIKQSIQAGGLIPGDRIEPESRLSRKYQVSRITLRRAIELLVKDGLLVRRHGVGTFVTSPRLTYPLIGLHSTRDLYRAYGWTVDARIVQWGVVRPTRQERAFLQLKTGEKVVRFVRCDVVGRMSVSVAHVALRGHFARNVNQQALTQASTYDLMEGKDHVRLAGAHQVFRASGASDVVAELLGVEHGFPILVLQRTTFDSSGVPVEWAVVSYRHDWVEFSIDLNRQPFGLSFAAHHPASSEPGHP